jgi:hypothetical protein
MEASIAAVDTVVVFFTGVVDAGAVYLLHDNIIATRGRHRTSI